MHKINFGWSLLAAGLLVGSTVGLQAKDKPADKKEAEAMMAQMQKYGTPGPEHQILQGLVGKYTATMRMWMAPGAKAQEMMGTSDQELMMDGRYLKQKFHGTWGGQPFEGIGITGYDKVRGEYQSIWFDNMGTGMMVSKGTPKSANVIEETGTFGCPMTGEKDRWFRFELKVVDANNYTYTSYGKDPAGKEFKEMEILYQRAK